MLLEKIKLVNPRDIEMAKKYKEIADLFPEEFNELGKTFDYLCFPNVYAFIIEDIVAVVFFVIIPGLKAVMKFGIKNKMILKNKTEIRDGINTLMKLLNLKKLEGFINEDNKSALKFMTWIGAKSTRIEKACLNDEGKPMAQYLSEYFLIEEKEA